MKQQTVLITGQHGFIGKHLSDRLLKQGYKVAGFPRASLFNPEDVKKVFEEVKPDIIFHLASYGNHSDQKDDSQTFISNVISTFFLLTSNIDFKARFINFSSSSVYGDKKFPMSLKMPLETKSMYGATKVCGEYLAKAMGEKHNFPVVNIRPFSVYGPGEAEHRFIPTVINKLINKETIKLEPDAMHDWIYIDDFIDGVELVMEKEGKFNIGTEKQTSNQKVVALIEKMMNATASIELVENTREQKPKMWKANTHETKLLGFKPKYELQEGLIKTIAYYVDKYQKQNAQK
jgi:nucleoside-diphosphate-sugar epimerase